MSSYNEDTIRRRSMARARRLSGDVFSALLDTAELIEYVTNSEEKVLSKNDYNFNTLLVVLTVIIMMFGFGAIGALVAFLAILG